MTKFDSLIRNILNKKHMKMKAYSDLGVLIFYFKSKPILIIDIKGNKLCFYKINLLASSNIKTVTTAISTIQWTNCKYLKENEWYGFLIDEQDEQLITKLIDDFISLRQIII